MKVYRYLSQTELDNILSGNISEIGQEYSNEKYKKINTHKYKENVKYLHFFKHKEDISKIKNAKFLPPNKYYICEFDIPILILLKGMGQGHYDGQGYSEPTKSVREYKIPNTAIKREYLKFYMRDKDSAEWDTFVDINSQISFESNKFDDDIMEK